MDDREQNQNKEKMERFEFITMNDEHANGVMAIYNYYVENSFAAYAEYKLPIVFFNTLLDATKGYPAFVIKSYDNIIGFCLLKAYNPFSTFNHTAEISYFIDEKHSGKGLGKLALDKLMDIATKQGITTILASVSSKNAQSLNFHRKNGFAECGRFRQIGCKFGETFDVIWFSKQIQQN